MPPSPALPAGIAPRAPACPTPACRASMQPCSIFLASWWAQIPGYYPLDTTHMLPGGDTIITYCPALLQRQQVGVCQSFDCRVPWVHTPAGLVRPSLAAVPARHECLKAARQLLELVLAPHQPLHPLGQRVAARLQRRQHTRSCTRQAWRWQGSVKAVTVNKGGSTWAASAAAACRLVLHDVCELWAAAHWPPLQAQHPAFATFPSNAAPGPWPLHSPVNSPMKSSSVRPNISTLSSAASWLLTGSRKADLSVAGAAWQATVWRMRLNRREAWHRHRAAGHEGDGMDVGRDATVGALWAEIICVAASLLTAIATPCSSPSTTHLVAHGEVSRAGCCGRAHGASSGASHLGNPPLPRRVLVHIPPCSSCCRQRCTPKVIRLVDSHHIRAGRLRHGLWEEESSSKEGSRCVACISLFEQLEEHMTMGYHSPAHLPALLQALTCCVSAKGARPSGPAAGSFSSAPAGPPSLSYTDGISSVGLASARDESRHSQHTRSDAAGSGAAHAQESEG